MMRSPHCPVCHRVFKPWEHEFESSLGRRKVSKCPDCRSPITWDRSWFLVFRVGCWMTMFGIFGITAQLFTSHTPMMIKQMTAVSFVVGILLLAFGACMTKLVVSDD